MNIRVGAAGFTVGTSRRAAGAQQPAASMPGETKRVKLGSGAISIVDNQDQLKAFGAASQSG